MVADDNDSLYYLESITFKKDDKAKIYTSDIRIGGWKAAPYEDSLTYRGNLLLFDKHYANLINYTSVEMVKQITDYSRPIHKDMFVADDITICATLNGYE